MDILQSSDAITMGMDCSNGSDLTKSMENYLSMMIHPSNGFVKSTADGMVLPQFPCLLVNYTNRPGPLVTPNLVPARPIYDLQDKTPKVTQRLVSESDTMCVDYRKHADIAHDMKKDDNVADPVKNRRNVPDKNSACRLNKFVRRLHDMLCHERNTGLVQWRRGLLVLLDTKVFAKQILPKYFNTRNFKTFRRQLNYYGFVHVRSYSNTGSKSTTALWVNQDLATGKLNVDAGEDVMDSDMESVASVLQLKRVDNGESVKTSEGRRERKELALSTIEDDLGVSAQFIALRQLHTLCDEHSNGKSEKSSTTLNQSLNQMLLPKILPKNSARIESQKSVVKSIDSHEENGESNGTHDAVMKPPTSSVSVANLLLLLSSG